MSLIKPMLVVVMMIVKREEVDQYHLVKAHEKIETFIWSRYYDNN